MITQKKIAADQKNGPQGKLLNCVFLASDA